MTDHEHPPVSGSESARAAEASSSSSSGKTAKTRLEELITKFKQMDSLKAEYAKEGCVNDVVERKKTLEMKEDLRKIVADIQTPGVSPDKIKLPDVAQKIIQNVKVANITSESAPVVYELLRISTNPSEYNLNTAEGLKKALDSILNISYFEQSTARQIITSLVEAAEAKGCPSDELKRAKEYINPPSITKTDLKRRRQERELQYQTALSPIKAIALGEAKQEKIRLEQSVLAKEAKASGLSDTDIEKLIQDKIAIETDKMHGEILVALNDVVASTGSQQEKIKALAQYNGVLSRLRGDGSISQADYHLIHDLPENPIFTKPIEDLSKKMEENDLVQRASSVFVPTEQQIRLLRGLSSAQSLSNFLQTETTKLASGGTVLRYVNAAGALNWDAFMKDVKGIFGELLSVADRNPNQFFEQAFNPMYEGHLYQVLLQRLTHLGAQVGASEDDWLNKQKNIEIKGQIGDPSPNTEEAPFKVNVFGNKRTIDLEVAIGQYLTNNMNDYKHVREHLHNINAICTQGLGWEQLKQYAERLKLDKLDKLVRQEEDLSLASNFYSAALQQEVAVNGRVIMSQFGYEDDVWQLNSAERKAFFQMKAHLSAKHPELKQSELNQQAIQKIRMAAAISYGLTGEFWNTMLTARMPMGAEKTVNAAGESVSAISPSYVGTEHRGYEKMIGELDVDMVLQRFALPKFYNALRYVPRYRDMKHPPDALSKEGWFHHGLTYEAKTLIEDALVNGRSDRLMELDNQYVFFLDYMRTKCVGLFARGGWRFTNWETCREYRNPQAREGGIDYSKTLANVRKMGSYITRRFIDELKPADIEKMNRAEVMEFIGINKAGSTLTAEERKLFGKEKLYERILFSQLANVAPTKFLQIEDRRWTPKGEKMLRNYLCDYLNSRLGKSPTNPDGYTKEILNLHVYNMYVSALTLVEKSTWKERKDLNQNYVLSSLDIDNHITELKSFFDQYRTDIGTHDEFGKEVEITGTSDEFIRVLKGFQTCLKDSINLPRYHNANNTGARETLQKRFANMLNTKGGDSKGNIENLIAGDDFNMENFFFSAGGGFGATRMLGETFNIASKMNPKLQSLINEAIPEFVKGQYKDIHEVEKAIKEKFVPLFKEIHGAIAGMDKAQADEYCISLALFVSNMIGKDRIARIKGFGAVVDWFKRNNFGTQSSLMQDFYRNDLMRPSHAMDSDEIHAFGHIILNALNVAFDERIPDHMETVKFLGIPITKKMVYKGEKWENKKFLGFIPIRVKEFDEKMPWSAEDFEKSAGLSKKMKWLETYIPYGASAILLILIAMAYLANKKNTKK